jgi:hypothetical protein
MRQRVRELSRGEQDDYDKAVLCILDDLETIADRSEEYLLEEAIKRMGWPEIHAFEEELRKGQDYREDAGGFMMRAIRRLFGMQPAMDDVTNYQQAARAMVAKAMASS